MYTLFISRPTVKEGEQTVQFRQKLNNSSEWRSVNLIKKPSRSGELPTDFGQSVVFISIYRGGLWRLWFLRWSFLIWIFFYTDARAHAVNMRLVSMKIFVGWPAPSTQQTSTLQTELLNRWRLVMCSRIVRYAPCAQTYGFYWHSVMEKFIEWVMKLVSKILVYCVTTALIFGRRDVLSLRKQTLRTVFFLFHLVVVVCNWQQSSQSTSEKYLI